MDGIIQGISTFRGDVFPGQRRMYETLVRGGQKPRALVIACADAGVSPEHITQAGPGDLLAYDGQSGRFTVIAEDFETFPVAQSPCVRVAAPEIAGAIPMAAE